MSQNSIFQSCKVVFSITFGQMIRGKRTIFILLVTYLPILLAIYYRLSTNIDMISPDQAFFHVMMFYLLFLAIFVALFYGTAVMADEIENKTITYLFTRPVKKYFIIMGKLAAYFLSSIFIIIPPMLIVFFIIATDSRMPIDFTTNLSNFSVQLGITILALVVYGLIFAFFGARLKHPMIYGLLFAFGWEKVILVIPGIVRKFSVAHYLLSIFPKGADIQEAMNKMAVGTDTSVALSLSILSPIAIVFLVLLLYTVYKKEYTFE